MGTFLLPRCAMQILLHSAILMLLHLFAFSLKFCFSCAEEYENWFPTPYVALLYVSHEQQ